MTILYWFNLIGTSVFALTGVLTAIRKRFDPIGVLVISTVTAIGGGTVRDLLLGIHPIGWVNDVNVLYTIFGTVFFSLLVVRFCKINFTPNAMSSLLIADALGLALFTINGTQIAEAANVHPIIAVVMGTLTGSAGGVFRDVLANEEPLLFRQTELYSTTSIFGAIVYLSLEYAGASRDISAVFGMVLIASMRLAALKWKIKLPVISFRSN